VNVRRWLWLISVLALSFLYAPLIAIVVQSFNAARHGLAWEGFTTNWYASLARNDLALHATGVTLLLAAMSTVCSTILATWLALGLSRSPFRGRRACLGLIRCVIVVPDVVMAVGLLMLYAAVREWLGVLNLGFATMLIAHITFQISFVTLVVKARLEGLDPALREAARDLGANRRQTFFYVTLPLIWPGVLAGALLAFTLSLDDFVISFFTTGPGATTLPVFIYSSVKRGLSPEIHALSTLFIVAAVIATSAILLLQRGRSPSAAHR
jgi:spermidine/putrescine transport system permease protein